MTDQLKIEKIEAMIKTNDPILQQDSSNLTNLVLSVNDQEDKDLMLEKTAIALAKVGQYDKSRTLLNEIHGAFEKTEGFIEIAAILMSVDKYEDAFLFLNNAETSADQIGSEWQKAELLNRIALLFSSMNKKEKAIEILGRAISVARIGEEASDIQDSVDCSSVLWDISRTLNKIGERERAIEIANSIKSPGKRENAIKMLA